MFTEDMPKIVAGYFKLFDAVEAYFKERCSIQRHSSQGELALVFKSVSGESMLYFALRWDLWSRMHIPLWIGVRQEWNKAAAEVFLKRNQGKTIMHEGYLLSPVDPAVAVDIENPQGLTGFLEQELAERDRNTGQDNG